MNLRILIKAIFFVFVLIDLSPSGKADENSFTKREASPQISFLKSKNSSDSSFIKKTQKIALKKTNDIYKRENLRNILRSAINDIPLLLANFTKQKNELDIQSEIQSDENNILSAKGNVIVSYKGNILKADSLVYDKSNKILIAKGNISIRIGEQIFEMDSFEYDFISKKGNLFQVKGLIKTDNLINDLFLNFDNTDTNYLAILEEIKKDRVLNTPNRVENWILSTDKIEVDGNKWKIEKVIFTNDLLELKQVKLEINSFEAISKKEELKFKSSLNYLTLEEKVTIPFWFGDKTLNKSGDKFNFENRWNLGFDNVDRDGYFLGRKLNPINLFNDLVLEVEPQFLVQRSIKGYTKSFVKTGDSITGNKVKRDTSFIDYFSLNSKIKGKINNWDLEIDNQLYSFDSKKFSDALRLKANLTKEITFLNSKWDKSFYGVYRDRVWNGSIGEAEIYKGYGFKLEKQNTWEINETIKNETITIGLGQFEGEALNSKNLVNSLKSNLFYSLEHKFPISVFDASNKFVDSSFIYIAEPIKKGMRLNTKVELLYSLYESGNHQEYLGFGAGPELIVGNFKNKYFDYTKISLLPFYKIKSGESIFKFDQTSEKFTLELVFDQQLFGPIILKSNATLNLDSDSKEYGDFINSKISLNWKKRSYEFGIFYQPHNEAGGIAFTLFGFK